jgi:hypothetical protein
MPDAVKPDPVHPNPCLLPGENDDKNASVGKDTAPTTNLQLLDNSDDEGGSNENST